MRSSRHPPQTSRDRIGRGTDNQRIPGRFICPGSLFYISDKWSSPSNLLADEMTTAPFPLPHGARKNGAVFAILKGKPYNIRRPARARKARVSPSPVDAGRMVRFTMIATRSRISYGKRERARRVSLSPAPHGARKNGAVFVILKGKPYNIRRPARAREMRRYSPAVIPSGGQRRAPSSLLSAPVSTRQ